MNTVRDGCHRLRPREPFESNEQPQFYMHVNSILVVCLCMTTLNEVFSILFRQL